MELNDTIITEDLLYEWNTYLARERVFHVVLKSVLLVLGILGNAAVLVIFGTKLKNERRERYFIPYLAAADVCATIVTCLGSIIMSIRYVTFSSSALCKIMWFATLTTTSTSAVYLLVICVFRYRRVCLLNKTELELKYKRLITFVVLLLMCVTSLPLFFIYGERKISSTYNGFNVSGTTCSAVVMYHWAIWKRIYLSVLMIISIAIVVAMVVLYLKIGSAVYRSLALAKERQRAKQRNNIATDMSVSPRALSANHVVIEEQPRKLRTTKAKHHLTYIFLTIIILYVITFIPSAVILVMLSFGDDRHFWLNLKGIELNALLTLSELYTVHHVVNPFVYVYFDRKFRSELTNAFLAHRILCNK